MFPYHSKTFFLNAGGQLFISSLLEIGRLDFDTNIFILIKEIQTNIFCIVRDRTFKLKY